MALEVRERFAEPVGRIPKTVVMEPFMTLLQSQERTILNRIEELKSQGLGTDGLNILLHWVRSAQANLIHWWTSEQSSCVQHSDEGVSSVPMASSNRRKGSGIAHGFRVERVLLSGNRNSDRESLDLLASMLRGL